MILFWYLLLAFYCIYNYSPKSKLRLWKATLLTPLIVTSIYVILSYGASITDDQNGLNSNHMYYFGKRVRNCIFPLIISCGAIYFYLNRKMKYSGNVQFPIILFVFTILALAYGLLENNLEIENQNNHKGTQQITNTEIEKENALTEMNLEGKVKSINEISYSAVEKFEDIVKGKRERGSADSFDFFIIFNEKGNQIEYSEYNSNGSSIGKRTIKYDEKGNQIDGCGFNSDGSLIGRNTYEYDEKGNKIVENYHNPNGDIYEIYTYKYDEKGNISKFSKYGTDGDLTTLMYSSNNKYDEKGNLIKQIYYDVVENSSGENTLIYDKKGNIIEHNYYDSDGSLKRKKTKKYDDKGNVIEKNLYGSDKLLLAKITYKYEHDKQENWIKQIEYFRGFPLYIVEREIEYFN